ncbi:MAG: hypothetical protein ACW98F_08705 [Candidatus Hodarchaeales archaeon]|jgi:hypothetical protein
MIHLFAICNIETGIGHEIFVNKNIDLKVDPTLLWPLVSALTAFSREFAGEGKLRSVHLANFQLVMYNPKEENTIPIAYIVLQDIFDNVGYTKAKIDAIDKSLNVFLSSIVDSNFSRLSIIPVEERQKIKEIIQFSQHFPPNLSKKITSEINRFEAKNMMGMQFLSLYIADLDEGIIKNFGINDPNERAIFQSFIPIIPSEKDLWLEALRTETGDSEEMDREGWIIKRVGKNTDFLLMCRFFYNNDIKPYLETLLNKINLQLYEGIKDQLPPRPF